MVDFPTSKIGEIYRNPEYNIGYIGHIGIEFSNGLVLARYRPMPKGYKPKVYQNDEEIGTVRYMNRSMRSNCLYAYTSSFDFEEDDILVPTYLLKSVQCISCGKIMGSLDKPCQCIYTSPILILQDYVLAGCELQKDLNYTNTGSTKENILLDFFKDEYSFLEIYNDTSVSNGDKWCQRINLDIDI